MINIINKKVFSGLFFGFLIVFITIFANVKQPAVLEINAADSFQESTIASGMTQPTAMEFAPDGRLFVLEKSGRVRIIKNGSLLSNPFLTLTVLTEAERGLLGIAFDPNFSSNNYVYFYYTRTDGTNGVSRFTASGDTAVSGSEVKILNLESNGGPAHNGGAIHFGTDGKLYIAVGSYDPGKPQLLSSRMGKILRINSDGTIPSDNPFVSTSGAKGEIWAYGFRNPYTFAVDPSTGKINVNDVGEGTWEEVNTLVKGGNYGWPTCEGPQSGGLGSCSNGSFVYPIYAYNHNGGSASITGGAFYNGNQFPSSYFGGYFFADYAKGFIKFINTSNQVSDFRSASSPVDLKVGPDGALYYASLYNGTVNKITNGSGGSNPTPTPTPTPTQSGTPPTASISTPTSGQLYNAGDTISYSGSGTDAQDGNLAASRFSWTIVFHHGTHTHPFLGPINGSTTGSFQIPNTGEVSADTFYRVHLTVTDSSGLTNEAIRDIMPRKSSLTFNTNISGLTLNLNGQPLSAPINIQSVVGFIHNIEAITQTLGGHAYRFVSWSDGGAVSHNITTPSSNTTYTATYEEDNSGSLRGDLNNDGIVNSLDWSIMNNKWFSNDTTADLNNDGIVNSLDFSIMNGNWSKIN